MVLLYLETLRYVLLAIQLVDVSSRLALNFRILHVNMIIVAAAYEDPHAFIPERWYSRTELVKDKRAFAPFGLGK